MNIIIIIFWSSILIRFYLNKIYKQAKNFKIFLKKKLKYRQVLKMYLYTKTHKYEQGVDSLPQCSSVNLIIVEFYL